MLFTTIIRVIVLFDETAGPVWMTLIVVRTNGAAMPRFRFQVRTGNAKLGRGTTLDFVDFDQALDVATRTMVSQALRAADASLKLTENVLEIIDEHGDIVASLPIGNAMSRQ